MKPVFACLAALVLFAAATEPAHAIWPFCKKSCDGDSCSSSCGPQGCGPGYPMGNMPYGGGQAFWPGFAPPCPPPCPPFQGVLPTPSQPDNWTGCPLPQHPYARSPRDFFMYYDRGPY
jgi:hypothetical protein